ncbi:hypothetical protein DEJ17_15815 [Curtobacterium sp. MCSS17_011]|uniref:cellulase-like family protein n=1 Tax=Curtobacterium sp. MCSS17_011 TaxID=2175643 RepID=UPI000D88FB9B|nr:cellulase-like family protein [Curtobacterium sp. MCSS17_011]PYY52589.1 hypothetical protein DEJ17_15815 [Curtobacterium sp. MCSS17_011]
MTAYTPVPLGDAVPDRLRITLWDFSWYVRTGHGDVFEDIDRAMADAVQRGFNTIRICAMPFLLFRSGLDTAALRLGPLGRPGTEYAGYAQGTRWYDVPGESQIDGRTKLLELFQAAKRHDVSVIVSSWEWQQSSAFLDGREWFDALMAVPADERAVALADAHADLIEFLREHDLDDRVAFVELHNEVQGGHLTEGLDGDLVVALHDRLSRGIARFHERLPDVPVTVNYAHVPVESMRGIPSDIDVLVVHPYIYGVLDEFVQEFGLRGDGGSFPQEHARQLLRSGAPDFADWTVAPDDRWRLTATIVGKPEIYVHDWCDPEAVDRWLYERYGAWRHQMNTRLDEWIDVAADHAVSRGVPLVLGEGYVGYTPLLCTFEEGPVGAEFSRRALRDAVRVGARGAVIGSNAAPQHPMWQDVELQRNLNALLT